jgi:hypothetical protein
MKSLAIPSAFFVLLAVPVRADTNAEYCGQLPPAVTATRDAIAAAAEAGDYDALAALADPATFTYSFGDGGDPAGYWRALVAEGTDVAGLLVGLLAMNCVTFDISGDAAYYEWPPAAEIAYEFLTPEEIAALQALYDGRLEDWYLEGTADGYYVGWRLLITADGRWSAFVAGD